MPFVAQIDTAIGPSAYEVIRDQIAGILGVEFLLQKASFGLAAELCPNQVNTERFVNVDESEFPVMIVRCIEGSYLDDNGMPTKDSSGTRFGTYKYFIDIYTGSPTTDNYFGDEIATKNLQRIAGIAMAILEDTRYATLGLDPRASGICGTHVERFFIKETGLNENEIDYIVGRIIFVVLVPEQVALPSPWSLLMTTLTLNQSGQNELIFSTLLQMQISVVTTGNTLTNNFFTNPIATLELLDAQGRTLETYVAGVDFTIAGNVATATTFTFTAGQTFVAKT